MGRRIGAYLAVIFITFYMFLMYNESALSAILVLECLYPVMSFFYLKWMKKRVLAGLGKVPAMGEKNKKIRMKIRIENKSQFWNVRYKVKLCVRSVSGQAKKQLLGTAGNAKRTEQEFYILSEYCGRLDVSLEYLWIYDIFGVFFIRKKPEGKSTVGIFPQYELIPVEITRRTREFLSDAEECSADKKGDDPSEIYQIREYRPKDSIHDVHWKLSAKEGALMVKEHGFPLGCVVLIWLDFPAERISAAGFDRMVERAASLSMTLAEEKCIHMAAWVEEKNARVVKMKVNSAEAAYELAWRLLDMGPYRDKEMASALYEDAFKGEHFSSIVTIDGQGELKVNGKRQELLQL